MESGPSHAGARDARLGLVLACFFLSGFAALIYQTAWTRLFAFVFGTSELAVATVLAAYMGGLALGSAVGGRLAPRVKRPVLVYGVLEAAIAAAALAVPLGVRAATALYVALFGGLGAPPGEGGLVSALFYLAASFLILMLPTAFMGATLPLLARHAVRNDRELGQRVGLLYATNTIGAVGGTLVSGFVLLPAIGLRHTIWVAVAANVLVFAVAALLARSARPLEAAEASGAGARAAREPLGWRAAILPLALVSGVVSFTYEVLWTRLLGHVLGASVYAFATMLASFLIGIALGSAVAARFATSFERSVRGFAWAQLGVAGLSLVAFRLVDRMPALSQALGAGDGTRLFADAAVAIATLLPAALCIGATFPLAVRVLARGAEDAGPASARVYAWNTVGAIIGAVGAGFFWIPALGYTGSLGLAVGLNLLLALGAILLVRPLPRAPLAVGALALAAVLLAPPSQPWALLRNAAMPRGGVAVGEVLHFAVGRSSTVLLTENPAGFSLRTNGLPESVIKMRYARPAHPRVAHWLGSIPVLVRPDTESLLAIGLGGGVHLEHVPPRLEVVDVVELEPEVVKANRLVGHRRESDPLADPRLRVVENDARGALLLTERHYDAIVSQPSHPWTAGASHLYSREFFELVRSRLSEDGVFVQWMGESFVDGPLVRVLIATLRDVFAHVVVTAPVPGGMLFVASPAPIDLRESAPRALELHADSLARLGVFRLEDAVSVVLADEAGTRALADGAPLNTDDRNLLQTGSPRVLIEFSSLARTGLAPVFAGIDPLREADPELDQLYMLRRLWDRGFRSRVRWLAEGAATPTRDAVTALGAPRPEAIALYEHALAADPTRASTRLALIRQLISDATQGARIDQLAEPLEPALREVVRGWRHRLAGRWAELAELDEAFASLRPGEAGYADATELRIAWRLNTRAPRRGREALRLLDELFQVTQGLSYWIQHAEAANSAGHPDAAARTLQELATRLRARPSHRGIARRSLRLLATLPGNVLPPAERVVLRDHLVGVARGTKAGSSGGTGEGA